MKSTRRQNEVGRRVLTWLSLLGIATIGVGTTACSDSTGPAKAVRIVPASPSVALQTTPQGQVLSTSVTITNTSSHPVAYSACGASLEKMGQPALPPGKSDWQLVWSEICALVDVGNQIGMNPLPYPGIGEITLQPSASAVITVYAVAGQQPYPQFTGEPGTYRVRIPVAVEILGKFYPTSSDNSVSEPFQVVPAP